MSANDVIVFPGPKEVEVQSRERPEPGPRGVLIKTQRTLISTGTELTVLSGSYPDGSVWDEYGTYPFDPGYNNVGSVVETGSEVTELSTGDRVVTWNPHAAYVTAAAEDCVKVPDGVSSGDAAFFAIAQIVMNGIRRGRLTWGEIVVVYGAGLLGQFAVRCSRVAGAERVVALDLAEERLAFLPDTPEVRALVPADDDSDVDRIRSAGGDRLADVVFEVTGNPAAIPGELDVLREQGRLVLLSSPHGETTFDFHDHCNAPSYEIIGAHQTSHPPVDTPQTPWTKARHAELYFRLLADDRIRVDHLITHRESYEKAPDVYDSLLEDHTEALGVIFEW